MSEQLCLYLDSFNGPSADHIANLALVSSMYVDNLILMTGRQSPALQNDPAEFVMDYTHDLIKNSSLYAIESIVPAMIALARATGEQEDAIIDIISAYNNFQGIFDDPEYIPESPPHCEVREEPSSQVNLTEAQNLNTLDTGMTNDKYPDF